MIKKAHFIYFYNQKSKRKSDWDLMRYIAIKSFYNENSDWEINYYTNLQPSGEYWERSKEYCKLHLVDPDTEIFGNPLIHPAHISDVFRLQTLIKHGGVYCDFDTITVGNFDKLIEMNKMLFADLSNRKHTIGNGVLIAPKDSTYCKIWLSEFKNFRSQGRDKYWDELSVKVHKNLMKREELENTFFVLPSVYFYPYSHYRINELYDMYKPSNINSNTHSIHLYDSVHYEKINTVSEQQIKENPTHSSFTYLINKYL